MADVDLWNYDWQDLANYPNVGKDKDNNTIELSFNGNKLLRSTNQKLILSVDAKAEKEKCANDFFYFVQTYCQILTLQEGKKIIELRPYQKEFLNLIHDNRFVISSQSRRAGKTTTVALYAVWCICFKKDFIIGVTSKKQKLVKEIVKTIKSIYTLLPPFLQSGIETWNVASVVLSNGCEIKSAVMSEDTFRGEAINILIIDESAHVDDGKYNDFSDSVMPTIATANNTKIIQISTPKGMNHFYRDVQEAKNGINGYIFYEVTWRDIDFYSEEWAKEEIARIGPVAFNQNYNVAFLGSSATLLSPEELNYISSTKQKPLLENYLHDDVKLYKSYNPNSRYLIVVDTSKTVANENPENDYISVNVLEMNNKIEQVCTYRTNTIHYTELAQIIYDIGEAFDFPLCAIENNEGSGTYTARKLHETLEYPNMYFDPNKDGMEVGVRTTKANRGVGLTTIKKLIDSEILVLHDVSTIDEFYTFVKIGKRYEAQKGSTDDCVMSLNILTYVLNDESNDLDLVLNDYLNFLVEEIEADEDQDLDIVGHVDAKILNDSEWLAS